ncbi:MAG: di-trans,poly-cis-decaprenylcistransferase [Parachlamydiales bacterium]|nr:di-trans,poly-cis-decaprenylcistransferase [Parachlamydiales bacterium]
MDGNRRWAADNGVSHYYGHWAGAQTLIEIVESAKDLGIKTLTVYSFSTENWHRPEEEREALFEIFEHFLIEQKANMLLNDVSLQTIGLLDPFPQKLKDLLEYTKQETSHCKSINLVLALNYGGRDEIRRAVAKISQNCLEGKITPESITEQTISEHLDTSPWGDLDILIRTSGEMRTSNFLLWQQHYAELFFTDTLWPDFNRDHLLDILLSFQKRNRRRGK